MDKRWHGDYAFDFDRQAQDVREYKAWGLKQATIAAVSPWKVGFPIVIERAPGTNRLFPGGAPAAVHTSLLIVSHHSLHRPERRQDFGRGRVHASPFPIDLTSNKTTPGSPLPGVKPTTDLWESVADTVILTPARKIIAARM